MKIRKAVIPIAGLGTRYFPASHAVKKELFTVVGPDGVARAVSLSFVGTVAKTRWFAATQVGR